MFAIINSRKVPVCGGILKYESAVIRNTFGKMYPYTCLTCGQKGFSCKKTEKHCRRELEKWYNCPKT